LLHELLPTAGVMALLVNPADRALAQAQAREMLSAARARSSFPNSTSSPP
jgi:hypothetical protein